MQISEEFNARNGASKVDMYKWVQSGKPGQLMYLPKRDLHVDRSYQRGAKNARVLKLVRRWNWLAAGVLIVARRDGKYFVVDGQHRLMAAMKRSDIELLPCLIFDSTSQHEEAEAFRDVNKERRPITTFEQWNANIVAGDEATLFCNRLIQDAGREPSQSATPNSVKCLSALIDASLSSRDQLIAVWPVVADVCKGHPLHEKVFGALLYLERYLSDGQSLTDKRTRSKVERLGYTGVLNAAQRASAFYSRGGPKVWALGVMQELNRGTRTNQLSMRTEVTP